MPITPITLKAAPAGTPAPPAETVAQVKSLAADFTDLVARALAKDAELDAYREVLTHYVDLLNQIEHSMRALQIAAEQAQPTVPQGADLERSVILLREAYVKYRDMGKE